jgi:hypothetical protein
VIWNVLSISLTIAVAVVETLSDEGRCSNFFQYDRVDFQLDLIVVFCGAMHRSIVLVTFSF